MMKSALAVMCTILQMISAVELSLATHKLSSRSAVSAVFCRSKSVDENDLPRHDVSELICGLNHSFMKLKGYTNTTRIISSGVTLLFIPFDIQILSLVALYPIISRM